MTGMATNETADSLSTRVVYAVADACDVDPFEMEPPLFHAIDLDALERLVAGGDAGLRVEFTYQGRSVAVEGDGTVTVDGTRYEGQGSAADSGYGTA